MAHTICVDGSNLVRGYLSSGAGSTADDLEETESQALTQELSELAESRSGRVSIEVFFDGGRRPWAGASAVRLFFAEGVAADELIVERVRALRFEREAKVTVVTGDWGLGARVEEEGGHWLKVRPGTGRGVLNAIRKKAGVRH